MPDFEIAWPKGIDADAIDDRLEAWIERSRLICSMRTSLAKHPGCTHWHVKSAGSSGTLEITMWPAAGRLWVSMRANRTAAWMDKMPEILTTEITPGARASGGS